MKKSKARYHSPTREQQALETRENILNAAERLLQAKGYVGMTIEAMAKEASVAPQTVYAVFGSKRGVLRGLIDRAVLQNLDVKIFERAVRADDALEIVTCAAHLSRKVYETDYCIYELLRGAGVVAPELCKLEKEREQFRYEKTRELVQRIIAIGQLKSGLDETRATDILWTLTCRDIYRMMVQIRKWPAEAFEAWAVQTLTSVLLSPR